MTTISTEVLVIGGGATGTGVAWDAALRGFDVVLVDRADLAEGTSGRFHGLLHSGGRYVVKDPVAADECVAENAILRRVIPDCIEDTGGLFVTTPDDDPAYGDRFLEGCRRAGLPTEEIAVGEALRMEPRLNPRIRRAFTAPDASIDAWKTVWSLARGAAQHGARVLTYHSVVGLHNDGDTITGARVRNELSGEELDIEAGFTLNASGAWAAQLVKMAGIEGIGVIPGKGIMIAMNHRLVNTVINRCTMPADGDILVPIRTVSVIGTTDIRSADPDELPVTQEEVDQMLDDGERLVPGLRDARALRVWAGVRPLWQDEHAGQQAADTRDVSRTHAVVDHSERDGTRGLLTMSGGKLTTLRLMAEDLVDAMCRQKGDERSCRTADVRPPGNEDGELYSLSSRLRRREATQQQEQVICECELIGRAKLEDTMRRRGTQNLDDIRRSRRLGMGPCQGGFCIYRATGDPARRGAARWRRGDRVADLVPAGALEGDVANPLRRPAPPGAAGRLDLPGPARRPAHAARRGRRRRGRTGGQSRRGARRGGGGVKPDVVVVGAGLAGLSAAVRLAEAGASVRVLAKGVGSTHLSAGTIDVLGYDADDRRVERPLEALAGLPAEHPYGLVGAAGVSTAVEWFKGRIADGPRAPYAYVGDADARVCVVGFRALKDFYPALVADNLSRGADGVEARSVELDLRPEGRAEPSALAYARGFDDEAFRAEVVAQVVARLAPDERVAFPAVLGLVSPHEVWSYMTHRLSRPVFEIPTLPPSVPGMRVYATLGHLLVRAGGRVVLNTIITGAERSGDRVRSLRARVGLREVTWEPEWVVLATGGFSAGGLELDSNWVTREVALGLPVEGAPPPGEERFRAAYFGGQPMDRVGVRTDHDQRPLGEDGGRMLENVLVAGATLAGAAPWREKSGDGIALATGFRSAGLIGGVATHRPDDVATTRA